MFLCKDAVNYGSEIPSTQLMLVYQDPWAISILCLAFGARVRGRASSRWLSPALSSTPCCWFYLPHPQTQGRALPLLSSSESMEKVYFVYSLICFLVLIILVELVRTLFYLETKTVSAKRLQQRNKKFDKQV